MSGPRSRCASASPRCQPPCALPRRRPGRSRGCRREAREFACRDRASCLRHEQSEDAHLAGRAEYRIERGRQGCHGTMSGRVRPIDMSYDRLLCQLAYGCTYAVARGAAGLADVAPRSTSRRRVVPGLSRNTGAADEPARLGRARDARGGRGVDMLL